MLTLGATLRQLRLTQRLTQDQLYGGIVSRSFAGRLERGDHEITTDKFFLILDRLNVGADEFRYVQQGYQPTDAAILESQAELAYDQQNFPWLRHLEQRYRDSQNPRQHQLAVVADVLIKTFGGTGWTPTPGMDRLYDQFNRCQTWNLNQIKLGTAWLAIAALKRDPQLVLAGIDKMHASCDRYVSPKADPFQVMNQRMAFDMLALQVLLITHQYPAAKVFRGPLLATHREFLNTDGEIQVQVMLCLWAWYFGDPQDGDHLAANLRAMPITRGRANLLAILTSYHPRANAYRAKREADQ